MKTKLLLSFVIIISVVAFSCRRNCCTPGPTNFMQAQKNASGWALTSATAITSSDSLTLVGQGNEEILSLKVKYTGVGKYDLSGTQARYTITVGHDAVGVVYIVDSSKENFVNVGAYDAAAGYTAGNFTLNLTKAPAYSAIDNAYPVAVSFTKGTFQMHLAK